MKFVNAFYKIGYALKPFLWQIVILLVSIVLGWYAIPQTIEAVIRHRLVLSPLQGPELYYAWLYPPIPFHFKIYLFNTTNPEEIALGAKPRLQEIGPYVFEEYRNRMDMSFNSSSSTIKFFQQNRFQFRRDLSGNLSLDDVITIINVPFVAAVLTIDRTVPWPMNEAGHMILRSYKKEPLFIQKTVDEVMFKGWKVPFLEQLEAEIGLSMLPNNTFGLFVEANTTNPGPYEVKTGIHGELGEILKYKNESTMNVWGKRDSICNLIKGTDGTVYAPLIKKSDTIYIYSPEFCVTLYTDYKYDVQHLGISGYRFGPRKIFVDPHDHPEEDMCFCGYSIDQCLGVGVLDLGPCRDGAPVAMSQPHFLDAIPEYLENIEEGLSPNSSKHETFIDIEPWTGIPLRARKSVQLNLILKPVKGIKILKKVRNMLLPLAWAEESANLDGQYADALRNMVLIINITYFGAKWISIAVSVLIIAYLIRKLNIQKRSKFGRNENCEIVTALTESNLTEKMLSKS